ncbi:MAG TPA: hypothetical protein VKU39_07775, partial [Streptosporangiaceae bacterium]|nr:hypothetical protein [Streptosporangiaceae bacterium]
MPRDASYADDEQSVLLMHPHWKTLVRPILVSVLIVAATLVVVVVIPAGKYSAVARLATAAVA